MLPHKEGYPMPAESLGTYILDHDEKSFYIDNGQLKEIEYSSGEVFIEGQERNDILKRNYNNYIDFKFSFDELNFESEEQAIEKLSELAGDISKIEIEKNNKTAIDYRQMKVDNGFDKLDISLQEREIRNFIEKETAGKKNIGSPEILDWERTKNGWGKEIVKIKIKRRYKRIQSMDDSVISIHTSSRDEKVSGESYYKVKPHIHITISRNNNWGKKYAYLKENLCQLFSKHELTSSHNVDIQRNRDSREYKEYRILKDRLTSFSWVVNKHEKGEYIIKQLNQYKRNSKCVKLDNIEEKLNRYLELGGSYDFARKIKINLKKKLDIKINLKAPEGYFNDDKSIKEGRYKEIITEVCNQVLNGQKISERYKEFAKEVLSKETVNMDELAAATAIKEIVKNRGFVYGRNYAKLINRAKINSISNKYIRKISRVDPEQKLTAVTKKIENREYLKQDDLRLDLKKVGAKISEVSELSEVAIVFQSNEKYIKEQLNHDSIKSSRAYQNILDQIDDMDLEISDNWKKKITKNICEEKGYHKSIKLYDVSKLEAGYNSIKNTCRKLNRNLKNLSGGRQDIISAEVEKLKNQTRETLILLKQIEGFILRSYRPNDRKIVKKTETLLHSHKEMLVKYQDKLKTLGKQRGGVNMKRFEVIAKINNYPEGAGNLSKKMILAENKEQAKEKFFKMIDKPGNIDKKHYTIKSIKEFKFKPRNRDRDLTR